MGYLMGNEERRGGLFIRAERAMMRSSFGVKMRDKKRTSELMSMLELREDIVSGSRE